MESTVKERHELPSRGIIEGTPLEVVIRNMMAAEEKMLLGSPDDVYDKIISNCIEEPEEFDMDSLCVPDKLFLLVKLRVISYGPKYTFQYQCPYCSKYHRFTVDLDRDFETIYAEEGALREFDKFELPRTKDEIVLWLPTVGDHKRNKTKAKRWHAKFPEAVGDQTLIYGMMSHISKVNGKKMNDSELMRYVEHLPALDSGFIRNRINRFKLGMDLRYFVECPNPRCQQELEIPIPLGAGFFHTNLGE